MYDPNILAQLHHIHHAKGITSKRQSNLKHPRAQPLHRFCNIRFATLSGNRQGSKTCGPYGVGKSFKFL